MQVGAPPEIACLLEGIRRENKEYLCKEEAAHVSMCIGLDPELDHFMVSLSLARLHARNHKNYIYIYIHTQLCSCATPFENFVLPLLKGNLPRRTGEVQIGSDSPFWWSNLLPQQYWNTTSQSLHWYYILTSLSLSHLHIFCDNYKLWRCYINLFQIKSAAYILNPRIERNREARFLSSIYVCDVEHKTTHVLIVMLCISVPVCIGKCSTVENLKKSRVTFMICNSNVDTFPFPF